MIEKKEEEPRPENPEVGWFRSLLPQIELLSPMDLLAFTTEVQQILYRYLKYPGMQGQEQYPNMQGQGQYTGMQSQGQYTGMQGYGQAAQQGRLHYASQNQQGNFKHQ
ncbi:hypothetical protein ElyMa_003314100 [Elysia marginata]|uniref:Uncharacterized protein n=1 Tax=Elysia marginata TaxID=1093978 RepID=A0AAV4JIT6_9GAST|nr:hypothetical protein ElyMa_003314100 [Elysia marginata]